LTTNITAIGYIGRDIESKQIIFTLVTGLPVIIVAWLLAFSVAGVGKFYNN